MTDQLAERPPARLEDPELVMGRIWSEVRDAPELAELAALLPVDRELGLLDVVPLLTVVLTTPVLKGPERQLAVVDALARAYGRGRRPLEDS